VSRAKGKPPVKLAHLLLVAAWSGKESSSATPKQAEKFFNDAKPETQRILERFAAVTERRYRIGFLDPSLCDAVVTVLFVLLCLLLAATAFWKPLWCLGFFVTSALAFFMGAFAISGKHCQPFTMDDLP